MGITAPPDVSNRPGIFPGLTMVFKCRQGLPILLLRGCFVAVAVGRGM